MHPTIIIAKWAPVCYTNLLFFFGLRRGGGQMRERRRERERLVWRWGGSDFSLSIILIIFTECYTNTFWHLICAENSTSNKKKRKASVSTDRRTNTGTQIFSFYFLVDGRVREGMEVKGANQKLVQTKSWKQTGITSPSDNVQIKSSATPFFHCTISLRKKRVSFFFRKNKHTRTHTDKLIISH